MAGQSCAHRMQDTVCLQILPFVRFAPASVIHGLCLVAVGKVW